MASFFQTGFCTVVQQLTKDFNQHDVSRGPSATAQPLAEYVRNDVGRTLVLARCVSHDVLEPTFFTTRYMFWPCVGLSAVRGVADQGPGVRTPPQPPQG